MGINSVAWILCNLQSFHLIWPQLETQSDTSFPLLELPCQSWFKVLLFSCSDILFVSIPQLRGKMLLLEHNPAVVCNFPVVHNVEHHLVGMGNARRPASTPHYHWTEALSFPNCPELWIKRKSVVSPTIQAQICSRSLHILQQWKAATILC